MVVGTLLCLVQIHVYWHWQSGTFISVYGVAKLYVKGNGIYCLAVTENISDSWNLAQNLIVIFNKVDTD